MPDAPTTAAAPTAPADWDRARPRLPDLALPAADGGAAVPLRAHRRASVLVLLDVGAEEHRAYLRVLAEAAPALAGWDGRVVVVAPGAGPDAPPPPDAGFPVAVDPDGRVAAAAGVRAPAVVVADQWGEVHAALSAAGRGGERRWPAPAELESWLRYLAVRCAG